MIPEEKKEKEAEKQLYMAQKSDLKTLMHICQPLVLLVYREVILNTSEMPGSLPSIIMSLLQEFEDVLPEELPHGLPPLRGIEHQIDFIPGA